MTKTRYRIQTTDGRYVSQQGTKPILVKAPALAYVWDTCEEAERMLPKYAEALEGESLACDLLGLTVQSVTL